MLGCIAHTTGFQVRKTSLTCVVGNDWRALGVKQMRLIERTGGVLTQNADARAAGCAVGKAVRCASGIRFLS
jgi:hypothetical protein